MFFEFWDARVGYRALTNAQFDLPIRGAMVSMPALEQDALNCSRWPVYHKGQTPVPYRHPGKILTIGNGLVGLNPANPATERPITQQLTSAVPDPSSRALMESAQQVS